MTDRDTGLTMDAAALVNFSRNTAAELTRRGTVRGASEARRLRAALRRVKAQAEACAARGADSGAAEWLADNWYVAEREGGDAVSSLRHAGRLARAAGSRRAVVAEAAAALAASGRGEVTGERMRVFLCEYRKTAPLTEKELSIFVPALKGALTEFLAGLCARLKEKDGGDLPLLMKNVFTSLRTLASLDASGILEEASAAEEALRRDPSGAYPRMDEDTRRAYRRELSRLAEKAGIGEREAAEKVLARCAGSKEHVGRWIFTEPFGAPKRGGAAFLAAEAAASLALAALSGVLLRSAVSALLLLFPLSEIVKNLFDAAAVRAAPPTRLPRMDLEGGVPGAGRTVCVVSALLGTKDSGAAAAKLLEEYRIANRDAGENLLFGILADLPESDAPEESADAERIGGAKAGIERLNAEYGGFFLFTRGRELCASSGRYMAKERKRGAILELARLLGGEKSALRVAAGDPAALSGVNFILTLDADTRLTSGSARELIAAALHPLNVPAVDAARGVVARGHGILQPRVSVELDAAGRSDFSRIFAGAGGLDPYGCAVSDIYQDLFGRGSFTGKGLISVPAYLACLDGAFPAETVLSHDLIEGAYLNCGFIGDVELTDGYPFKVVSYFARLERWTRGDWQNIRWLGRRVENAAGARVKNPLGAVDRWKIFDNLRRSLVPVFTLAALLAGMLSSGAAFAAAGAAAVLASMSPLLLTSAAAAARREGGAGVKYHSAVISGLAGAVMQTLIRLMLLPQEAWVCASAIAAAAWRMLVTKRHLLDWVTASDSERLSRNTLFSNYVKLAACPAAGLLVALLTPHAAAAAVGLVWIFAPAYAYALSRPTPEEPEPGGSARAFLLSCAGDIWRYFSDFLTEKDHFLPPDNYQEQPACGLARRTSPTNIGLAMLSAVAAGDLGIVGKEQAAGLVSRILGTVEKLPKWRGHLYNWYDTGTLAPLCPKSVSTVDSGNLAACLTAVREALLELGRTEDAARCAALLDAMRFGPLYDAKRRLFRIGWDAEKDEPAEGWYDLLASEARLTSYLAVARGDVPRRHWRSLGRALVSLDGFSGMASWTGTMFEYLMPNLLLPCYRSSLLYESARFCVYAQKRAHPGCPWGISESAFFAFDPGLCYRYKAHGVQRLALKRGMGREIVVSPYSSFLALQLAPRSAVRNLKRLASLGAVGKYGFYEAVDFTPSRRTEGGYQVVRTWMAHHLGMSLAAADNALNAGILQRRFMRGRETAAFAELLQERIPAGEVHLRQPPRDVPEKLPRREGAGYIERLSGCDALRPHCLPLSSGAYSVLLAETGKSRSVWRGLDVTRFGPEPEGACGMEFWLRTPAGVFPLQPAPAYRRDVEYASEFCGTYGVVSARFGGFRCELTAAVPPSGDGETRTAELSFFGRTPPDCGLVCVFEPVLQRRRDFAAHPAFSRLALEAQARDGALLVRRRGREPGGDVWLCLACSGPDAEFATEPARGVFPQSVSLKSASPDLRVSCTARVRFRGGRAAVSFALAAADRAEDALLAARRMLERREKQDVSRLGAAAIMLGGDAGTVRRALSMAPELVFGAAERGERARALLNGAAPEALWRFGVSGDLPVIAAPVKNEREAEAAVDLLRSHALLAENGVESDLLLFLTDGGDYRQTQRRAVLDFLRRTGREGTLGAAGGVHLADAGAPGARTAAAMAEIYDDLSAGWTPPERKKRLPLLPAVRARRDGGKLEYDFGPDGEFAVSMEGRLPPAAWSNVLTNGEFGFLAADAGTGHLWRRNAREGRVDRWLNDPLTALGTERLELLRGGGRFSLFADGGAEPARFCCGFGYAVWEKRIGGTRTRVTAFVPGRSAARVLLIETENAAPEDRIAWSMDLVLGGGDRPSPWILTGAEDGVFTAADRSGGFGGETFRAAASAPPAAFTSDRSELLFGGMSGKTGIGFPACAAAEFPAGRALVLAVGCCDAAELKRLASEGAARRALDETKRFWSRLASPLRAQTPSRELNEYLNGWALYQTIACRLVGRTALYQSGGAYGFRDQLQDASACAAPYPELTADQLRRAAAHQYVRGDVMHWWHPLPEGDRGVRTRCSDDLLWLPWALCDYVRKTGDAALCGAREPYLDSPPLADGERDRYERAERSGEADSLLGHAMRAADEFLRRGTGAHGLALVLGGDWNDGMDAVGRGGRGESVWLTWFGSLTLRALSRLCREQGEAEAAGRYEKAADALREAGEAAWDGDWFLRGWYDGGAPLGGAGNGECELDSVAQSFAAFAGAAPEKCRRALESAWERLYDPRTRTVKLFDPPFGAGTSDPGYIRAYAPGFRENGGQYTHAAVWLAMAMLDAGMTEKGCELLLAILPGGRNADVYAAEPYVLAGDVCAAPESAGRGGWSWYTGAAGWFYTAAAERLLGLRVRKGRLFVEPRIPADWEGFSAEYRTESGTLHIRVGTGPERRVTVDGAPYDPRGYPLR